MRVLLLLVAIGCGGDDDGGGGDAAVCELPSDPLITCTVGDDTPCTAVCGVSYCFLFGGGGGGGGTARTVCTRNCMTVDDCPAGWSCNMMGRCRPPD
jgi:hypothetical protein